MDDFSYLLREPGVLFTGDAIPVPDDIPIYINSQKSLESLNLLHKLSNTVQLCCPAWDTAYWGQDVSKAVENGIKLIESLECKLHSLMQDNPNLTVEQYTALLCEKMQTPQFLHNPLFKQTVRSHIH